MSSDKSKSEFEQFRRRFVADLLADERMAGEDFNPALKFRDAIRDETTKVMADFQSQPFCPLLMTTRDYKNPLRWACRNKVDEVGFSMFVRTGGKLEEIAGKMLIRNPDETGRHTGGGGSRIGNGIERPPETSYVSDPVLARSSSNSGELPRGERLASADRRNEPLEFTLRFARAIPRILRLEVIALRDEKYQTHLDTKTELATIAGFPDELPGGSVLDVIFGHDNDFSASISPELAARLSRDANCMVAARTEAASAE